MSDSKKFTLTVSREALAQMVELVSCCNNGLVYADRHMSQKVQINTDLFQVSDEWIRMLEDFNDSYSDDEPNSGEIEDAYWRDRDQKQLCGCPHPEMPALPRKFVARRERTPSVLPPGTCVRVRQQTGAFSVYVAPEGAPLTATNVRRYGRLLATSFAKEKVWREHTSGWPLSGPEKGAAYDMLPLTQD
jgi:hypothetical protein